MFMIWSNFQTIQLELFKKPSRKYSLFMSECKTNSKVSSNQIANYGNFHNSIKRTKTNYDEKLYKTVSNEYNLIEFLKFWEESNWKYSK